MPMRLAAPRLEADAATASGVAGARIAEARHPRSAARRRSPRASWRPGASSMSSSRSSKLEQPRAAGRGAGEGVDHQAELAHRHLQDGHEGQERGSVPTLISPADHLVAADPEHQAHGGEEREVHGAGVARRGCRRAGGRGRARSSRRGRTSPARGAARRRRAPRGCRRGSPPSPGVSTDSRSCSSSQVRAQRAAASPTSARRRTARSSG